MAEEFEKKVRVVRNEPEQKYFLLAVEDVVFKDGNIATKLSFFESSTKKFIDVWSNREQLTKAGFDPNMVTDLEEVGQSLELDVEAQLGKKARISSISLA